MESPQHPGRGHEGDDLQVPPQRKTGGRTFIPNEAEKCACQREMMKVRNKNKNNNNNNNNILVMQ